MDVQGTPLPPQGGLVPTSQSLVRFERLGQVTQGISLATVVLALIVLGYAALRLQGAGPTGLTSSVGILFWVVLSLTLGGAAMLSYMVSGVLKGRAVRIREEQALQRITKEVHEGALVLVQGRMKQSVQEGTEQALALALTQSMAGFQEGLGQIKGELVQLHHQLAADLGKAIESKLKQEGTDLATALRSEVQRTLTEIHAETRGAVAAILAAETAAITAAEHAAVAALEKAATLAAEHAAVAAANQAAIAAANSIQTSVLECLPKQLAQLTQDLNQGFTEELRRSGSLVAETLLPPIQDALQAAAKAETQALSDASTQSIRLFTGVSRHLDSTWGKVQESFSALLAGAEEFKRTKELIEKSLARLIAHDQRLRETGEQINALFSGVEALHDAAEEQAKLMQKGASLGKAEQALLHSNLERIRKMVERLAQAPQGGLRR